MASNEKSPELYTHNPASEKARYNMRISTTVTGMERRNEKPSPEKQMKTKQA
jgi:hypothetical protein